MLKKRKQEHTLLTPCTWRSAAGKPRLQWSRSECPPGGWGEGRGTEPQAFSWVPCLSLRGGYMGHTHVRRHHTSDYSRLLYAWYFSIKILQKRTKKAHGKKSKNITNNFIRIAGYFLLHEKSFRSVCNQSWLKNGKQEKDSVNPRECDKCWRPSHSENTRAYASFQSSARKCRAWTLQFI